jgi:hypothetical protein
MEQDTSRFEVRHTKSGFMVWDRVHERYATLAFQTHFEAKGHARLLASIYGNVWPAGLSAEARKDRLGMTEQRPFGRGADYGMFGGDYS